MFGGVLRNLMASGADDAARIVASQGAKAATNSIGDDVALAASRQASTASKPYRIHDLSAIDEDRAAHLLRQGYTVAKDSSGKSINLSDMKPIGGDILDNLNPTGGVFVDYNPQARATIPLADNIKTLADTAKMNPDDLVDIYRGLPDDVEAAINPGDFITTNPELAKSYGNNVHKMQVRYRDILDDINEPLGEEYIYRPQQEQRLPVNIERRLNAQGKEWIQASLGDNQGYVGGFELPSAIRISTSNIRDEALRGKGYGREMYEKLIAEAANAGKILQSDITVEPAAQRVYDSLKKRGYDVRIHPAAKKLDDGSLFVDLNEPVYTIVPGKNATKNNV
jgi:hypothetical protein